MAILRKAGYFSLVQFQEDRLPDSRCAELRARKAFFTEKALDLNSGYGLLFGTAPSVKDLDVETAEYSTQFLFKQFMDLFSKERLADGNIPLPFEIHGPTHGRLGLGGTMDPFKELNEIVFQLTVRLGGCRELAEDPVALWRMTQLFDNLEKSATPASLLLLWLPSPARKATKENNHALFALIKSFVEIRRAATVRSSDTVDVLLGNGFSTENIVDVWYLNTGMTGRRTPRTSPLPTHSTSRLEPPLRRMHPEWKDKLSAEFQAFISKHTDATTGDAIHERLASIPLSTWETELPVVEVVMRETLRMTIGLVTLRRNPRASGLGGRPTNPHGRLLVYPIGDVHQDPDIYSRAAEIRPESARLHGDARREAGVKLILALFFSSFDFEVVNGAGEPPKSLPRVDFNDFHRPRPVPGNPCYIKLKRLHLARTISWIGIEASRNTYFLYTTVILDGH
ncbi:cytochrome P450 [Mycena vulgaris]|nr:cytochrome P450 [Mycena vulgaris]